MDERNLENSMPYFPMEQDWSQMARPSRILLDECFPGKYSVNSLPLHGAKQAKTGLWVLRGKGKGKAPPLWSTSKHRHRSAERAEQSYPNTIPVDSDARQTLTKPNAGID